jgi:release factor glutamine methyltransferase
MKTLGEVLNLSIQYFQDRKISRPRRQVEELLTRLLGLQRIELYMHYDRPLEEKELSIFREWVFRRGKGEPLDYILTEVSFFNCVFEVNSSVLIPRPETEILLDMVCSQLAKFDLKNKVAWDICSGSGCLGIALKKKFPELQVVLSDISPAALAVARKNALRNGAGVVFMQGDLLAPFQNCKADFILCNPPYISESEYKELDHEVRDFEPKEALIGGATGLEFYEQLARELPECLNPKGRAFFEIGTGQGEKICSLFDASCWKSKIVEKDWSGHDRFFFLEKE